MISKARCLKKALVRLTVLCACCVWGMAHAAENDEVAAACSQTVMDYAFYRDRPDADKVAELFTPDASMSLLGEVFAGRGAIRDRVAAGAGGAVFRHLISTINIVVNEGGLGAQGVSYVTVYRGSASDLPQPLPDRAMAIGEYHDRFVMSHNGCQIAERAFVPVFLPQDG